MRSQRRQAPASDAEAGDQAVSFRDFELFDEITGVSAMVYASELQAVYAQIAATAGVPPATLLANSSISANTQLHCHLVQQEPGNGSWSIDSEGYVMLHLKQSCTVRGHSFLAGESRCDDDFVPPSRVSKRSSRAPHPATPPQRRQRVSTAQPRYCEDSSGSSSELSPASAKAGCTQPLMVRLHRAAFLATCDDPNAYSGMEIRHICGNKACAVVSHFRAGSSDENAKDKQHHKRKRGSSWQGFQAPQK